ncbi:MAG: hypothetical protein JXA90_13985, partial [Planctomycetes bacterium]|nr:hypothetical protein [Planctomycetota bacterium]
WIACLDLFSAAGLWAQTADAPEAAPPAASALSGETGAAEAPEATSPLLAAAFRKSPPDASAPASLVEPFGKAQSARSPAADAASESTGSHGAERAAPARRHPSTLPWIEVESWHLPSRSRSLFSASPRGELPAWALFLSEARFDAAPPEARICPLPLLYCPPPRESGFARAAKHLVQRKFYSEVRRLMKRTWRQEFRETPTMSYSRYLEGVAAINQVGKSPEEYDVLNADYFENQFRQDVFRRSDREGERDFEIFAWGPVVIMDSGSVHFDLGRAVSFDVEDDVEIPDVDRARPLLASRSYKVHTSINLGLDPIAAGRQDPTWLVDRYGLTVEVDWLSSVLGREMMTTELEVEFERDGEFAAMVNFVFKSRK